MADSLIELFESVRCSRPPVYDADRWSPWLAALGQVVAAFPTTERRGACVVLVADDLAKAVPGVSLSMAYGTIARAVLHADVLAGNR